MRKIFSKRSLRKAIRTYRRYYKSRRCCPRARKIAKRLIKNWLR